MARSTAGALVGGFAEAVAKMIESFGTFVVVGVIALIVGSYTRSWPWAIGIGAFGFVGSALSLYYRSRESLNRSLTSIEGGPKRHPGFGHGSVLEADLSLPAEIRQKAEWMEGGSSKRGSSAPQGADE